MQLRSGLFGIITLLAATGSVFTASFAAPFSVLPVMAQTSTEQEAEADQLFQQGIEQYKASQFQAAIQSWQQALDIYMEIENSSGITNSLNNLGNAYRELGQYQKAIEFSQKSLAIAQEIGDRSGEAYCLNNIGNIYFALGQYQKAIEFYLQSLAIAQEIGDRSREAKSLGNLGIAYFTLGQYQQAMEFHQQSRTIFQEIGDYSGEGATLNALGNIYFSLKEYQKAIEFYLQSLAIDRETGDHSGEAKALGNLGNAYDALGQYQKAIEFYIQSLAIDREIGNRYGQAKSLSKIGFLLKKQNQLELAIIFLKQSVNVTETIRYDIQGLSRELQESFVGTCECVYRDLADLLLQQNRILEAQRVLDLLKVQELNDYLHNVRGNEHTAQGIETLPSEQQILAEYNQLQNQAIEIGKELAQLRQIPESKWTPAQEQRIAELVTKQGQLKRLFVEFTKRPDVVALVNQLNQTAKEQSLQLSRLTNISDNLRNLEQNAVLLYPLILEDRLELVLASPDSPPIRRTVQVTREELNRTIVEFRQALQNPRSDAVTPARQLYDWLIRPLENDLATANAQTIIYAPDAQLRYIPLAALHDGTNWLVQRFRVNNITADSLTDFDNAPQAQLRILAGAFTQGSYSFSVGNEQFTFAGLPFAGKEVEILAEAIPNTTKLVDEEFSKTAILPRMDNHSIVHFATHGALVQGLPDESFILLGNGDRISMREVQNTWFLTNVDLIVLSACETGLGGQFGTGEEILGFGYLMQNAGARAAIASLWQVSDGGTQALMNAFYKALQGDKITKAEALRQAQIALITGDYTALGDQRGIIVVERIRDNLKSEVANRLNHPYYWAPFILIGNGL